MIKFSILECGRIAKRHSESLDGIHIQGVLLIAVCDPVPARAGAIAAKFSLPAVCDIDNLLVRKDINAVTVLTPSGMHLEHVIVCANARKHVVVENPMALRLQDADDKVRACDEARVLLFVVKQNRFNSPISRAREALDAGGFGQLILGAVRMRWCCDQNHYDQDAWRGTWACDGDAPSSRRAHPIAAHALHTAFRPTKPAHIDMLEWFFGDVVRLSRARNRGLGDNRNCRHGCGHVAVPQQRV